MLKIRLFRIGMKKKPFYRIVVIDSKKKRNGLYKECLGFLNPIINFYKINIDRIKELIKNGAQLSDRVKNLFKKNQYEI